MMIKIINMTVRQLYSRELNNSVILSTEVIEYGVTISINFYKFIFYYFYR